MFRLYFSIFFNKKTELDHFHGEGTFSMKLPLVILSAITIVAGFIPFAQYVTSDHIPALSEMHLTFSIAPVLTGLAGIGIAYVFYFRKNDLPDKVSGSVSVLYKGAYNKFYIDEIYLFITQKFIFNFLGKWAAWIDKNIVDGMMNFMAFITGLISELIRSFQSGKIQAYGMYFIGGIICITVYLLYFNS